MWDWLQGLSGGAANFVGSLTGSLVGLLALLCGAMFNAHLNRSRDDRLRNEERAAVATTLFAELSSIHRTMTENAKDMKERSVPEDNDIAIPDLTFSRQMFPQMLSKIGLLDHETIGKVVSAYVLVAQYPEALVLLGGKPMENMPKDRQVFVVDGLQAKRVALVTEVRAEKVKEAIEALRPYLKR